MLQAEELIRKNHQRCIPIIIRLPLHSFESIDLHLHFEVSASQELVVQILIAYRSPTFGWILVQYLYNCSSSLSLQRSYPSNVKSYAAFVCTIKPIKFHHFKLSVKSCEESKSYNMGPQRALCKEENYEDVVIEIFISCSNHKSEIGWDFEEASLNLRLHLREES